MMIVVMQDRTLFRRHGLRLVTSSLIYERMTRDFPRSASQVMSEADAMAASPQIVALAQRDLQDSTVKEVPAMQVMASPASSVLVPAQLFFPDVGLVLAPAVVSLNWVPVWKCIS